MKLQRHILIINDIRSAYNVGSLFRTADAVGVSKIYLTGHTPTPIDRFGRARKDIAKTALGAEKTLLWEYEKNVTSLIKKLKKNGFYTIAIEQDKKAVDYKTISPAQEKARAFIMGGEVNGLAPQVLKQCDAIVEIPMRGSKESLNVSVAAGIVLYRMLDIKDTLD